MATAQFSSPIPQSAGITTYSILFQGYNPSTYAGYNLLNYGQTAAIGWNKICVGQYGHCFSWDSPYSPDPAYYMNYLYDTTTPDRTTLASRRFRQSFVYRHGLAGGHVSCRGALPVTGGRGGG